MPKETKSDAGPHAHSRKAGIVLRWSWVIAVALAAILAAVQAAPQKKPPAQPLDLNAATVEQLEQLPGMQKGIAEAIVKFREKSGPFQRVEDLRVIRGISKARLEKLRPYVTVNLPVHTSQ